MRPLAQLLTFPDNTTPTPIVGPLGNTPITLGTVLNKALAFVFPIAGIGLLIVILIAGFTLLTSAGDAKKMEQGKHTLTYGVVGFLIIFVAYWITQLLGVIFGIDSISKIFG